MNVWIKTRERVMEECTCGNCGSFFPNKFHWPSCTAYPETTVPSLCVWTRKANGCSSEYSVSGQAISTDSVGTKTKPSLNEQNGCLINLSNHLPLCFAGIRPLANIRITPACLGSSSTVWRRVMPELSFFPSVNNTWEKIKSYSDSCEIKEKQINFSALILP